MMQRQSDMILVQNSLPFDYCISEMRESIARSGLEIVGELPVHRYVQRKLGLQVFKCTVLTVWDPLLTYLALTAEQEPPCFTPFVSITVWEDGPGSAVLAPRPSLSGFAAGRAGSELMVRTLDENITKVLADVAETKAPKCNSNNGFPIPSQLRRRARSILRLVTGGAK